MPNGEKPMNKEERKKLLSELSKSPQGKALADFLDEELAKLDSVKGVTSLDEALGRGKAVEIIERLFSFMERRNPQVVHKGRTYT